MNFDTTGNKQHDTHVFGKVFNELAKTSLLVNPDT